MVIRYLIVFLCFGFIQTAQARIDHPEKIGIGTWEPEDSSRGLRDLEWMNFDWYYIWGTRLIWAPEGAPRTVPLIPMIWDETNVNDVVPRGSEALLGFNEPDGAEQANISVGQAISLWPKLMAHGLRLGSPATTTPQTLGSHSWLGRFMREADNRNYRVDFIAVHYYVANKDVNAFKRFLESVHQAYGRPVWVTEWALVDWNNPGRYSKEEVATFARDALEMLDDLPFVEKHAYFSTYRYNTFNSTGLNTELFDQYGNLTPAGRVFKNALSPSQNAVHNGDFELGSQGWENWGYSQTTSKSESGRVSMATGTGAGGIGQNVISRLTAGSKYRLSAFAKIGDNSNRTWFGIKFIDSSGRTIQEKNVEVKSLFFIPYNIEFQAPSGAAQAYVYTWKSSGSSLLVIDRVELMQQTATVAEPEPENLVRHSGFESGTLTGWTSWGNSRVVSQNKFGNFSSQTGTGSGGIAQDVIQKLKAGFYYKLSVQARVTSSSEQAWVGIKFMDSSGRTLKEKSVAVTSTSFAPYEVQIQAPSGASKAYVYTWKSSGSGYLLADEFRLVERP